MVPSSSSSVARTQMSQLCDRQSRLSPPKEGNEILVSCYLFKPKQLEDTLQQMKTPAVL